MNVAVMGDLILDCDNYGSISKLANEDTRVGVFQGEEAVFSLGGAGRVARRLIQRDRWDSEVTYIGLANEAMRGKIKKQIGGTRSLIFYHDSVSFDVKNRFYTSSGLAFRTDGVTEGVGTLPPDFRRDMIEEVNNFLLRHDGPRIFSLVNYSKGAFAGGLWDPVFTSSVTADDIVYLDDALSYAYRAELTFYGDLGKAGKRILRISDAGAIRLLDRPVSFTGRPCFSDRKSSLPFEREIKLNVSLLFSLIFNATERYGVFDYLVVTCGSAGAFLVANADLSLPITNGAHFVTFTVKPPQLFTAQLARNVCGCGDIFSAEFLYALSALSQVKDVTSQLLETALVRAVLEASSYSTLLNHDADMPEYDGPKTTAYIEEWHV